MAMLRPSTPHTSLTSAFRNVVDGAETPVIVLDQAGDFLYCNASARSLFGYGASGNVTDVVDADPASIASEMQYLQSHTAWSGRLLIRGQQDVQVQVAVNAFRAPVSRPELIAFLHPTRQDGDAIERLPEAPVQYQLARREVSLLHLLAEGFSDKEIANVLGVSVWTVNKNVGSLLKKMNAMSRTVACITAIKTGIIA
jgi:DNA-binding NarL/FixJ family response regulator